MFNDCLQYFGSDYVTIHQCLGWKIWIKREHKVCKLIFNYNVCQQIYRFSESEIKYFWFRFWLGVEKLLADFLQINNNLGYPKDHVNMRIRVQSSGDFDYLLDRIEKSVVMLSSFSCRYRAENAFWVFSDSDRDLQICWPFLSCNRLTI